MSGKKIFLISSILLVKIMVVHGQSSVSEKTLAWHSARTLDRNSDEVVHAKYILVTNGNATINLLRDNEQTITFTIESIARTWLDEKTDGSIIYKVHYKNDVRGTITIERLRGDVKAYIDFTGTDPHAMNLEISIDSVQ